MPNNTSRSIRPQHPNNHHLPSHLSPPKKIMRTVQKQIKTQNASRHYIHPTSHKTPQAAENNFLGEETSRARARAHRKNLSGKRSTGAKTRNSLPPLLLRECVSCKCQSLLLSLVGSALPSRNYALCSSSRCVERLFSLRLISFAPRTDAKRAPENGSRDCVVCAFGPWRGCSELSSVG